MVNYKKKEEGVKMNKQKIIVMIIKFFFNLIVDKKSIKNTNYVWKMIY